MRPLARLTAIGAVTASSLVTVSISSVDAQSVCTIDQETRKQSCVIVTPPGGPDRRVDYPNSSITWVRINFGTRDNDAVGTLRCPVRTEVIDGVDTEIYGTMWAIAIFSDDTTAPGFVDSVCEYPGDTPPEPPPPPPTEAQYVDAIEELLQVDFELSPPPEFEGITGLDTWFWCDTPDTSVIEPIELAGWSVGSTMNAVSFAWSVTNEEIGFNGAGFEGLECGEEPDLDGDRREAAWIWQPQGIGDYTVGFAVDWFGFWTQSYQGVVIGTFPLGPVEIDADPIVYPVDEYVGVLVHPGDLDD